MQVTKAWLVRGINRPFISIFKNTNENLLITEKALEGELFDKEGEKKKRIMLTRVRVKGILEDLLEATNIE